MQRVATAVLFVGPMVLFALRSPVASAEPAKAPNKESTELQELQKERIAVLSHLVHSVEAQYIVGTADFLEVAQAHRELLDARLDSVESPAERIAFLEDHLKVAKRVLDVTEARFNAGRIVQRDFLRSKALYLEAKIHLAREHTRLKSPGR